MISKLLERLIDWPPVTRRLRRLHRLLSLRASRWHYCHDDESRLHIGHGVSTMNALFNTASGHIYVGAHTIFGHNCMVLTGRHEFLEGRRKKLVTGGAEAPLEGHDVRIGSGCWIASGAIICGGVTIGDNTIVAAGAVVTHDLPAGVFAAGIPARVIRTHAADPRQKAT